MYSQLSNRNSLSDLVLTVNAHSPKAYHPGFGKRVLKVNLGKSNANRNCRIYRDFTYHLFAEARNNCLADGKTQFFFSNSVYAFDSTTTIDTVLWCFCLATFRRAKGANKLLTQNDVRTSIPVFINLTDSSVYDMQAMGEIVIEPLSLYFFYRGCLEYDQLFIIYESKSCLFFEPKITYSLRGKIPVQFKKNRIKI